MKEQYYWNDIYHGNAPFTMTRDVMCKAGEGAAFTDPEYQSFLRQAAALGLTAWAYYALHAGTPEDMDLQAHRAAGLIGTRPAAYDVEWWPKQSGSAAGIARLPSVCQAIDAFRRDGGVMHVAYLPRSMWERMGSPSLKPLGARGIRIINADYRRGSSVPGSAAWEPYGDITPWAVQYAPCHNTAVGTRAEIESIWRTGSAPTVPSAPATKVYIVQPGDTLFSIAKAHGMTLPALEAMNPSAGHPAGNFDLIRAEDRITVKA